MSRKTIALLSFVTLFGFGLLEGVDQLMESNNYLSMSSQYGYDQDGTVIKAN